MDGLLEIWCNNFDLLTLIKLSQLNTYFYSMINTIKLKSITNRFYIDCIDFISLKDCYQLNDIKCANNYEKYIDLCTKYDSYYLLKEWIESVDYSHYFFDELLDQIHICNYKNSVLINHIVRTGYIWFSSLNNVMHIFNDCMKKNNTELVKVFLSGYKGDDCNDLFDQHKDPYFHCISVEMYLLLKDEYSINHTDLYYTLSQLGNKDILINCIIEHGNKDAKSTLLFLFMLNGKEYSKQIYNWINDEDIILVNYFSIKDFVNMTRSKNAIINLCKYGHEKDKLKLLEINRTTGVRFTLDCMFKYSNARKYLSSDYFDKKRSKIEVLNELIRNLK